ncbi:MAG: AraC family transcriptional regulator [Gammaproteobacteria bacterium]|jgi:hypothetical protein|nr:AraC family transcriptional regulator [Gammaproteobacteria bacterium]
MKLNRIISILVCGALLSPAWVVAAKNAPPKPVPATEAPGADAPGADAPAVEAPVPAAEPSAAAPDAPPAELRTLDQEVQGLKKDVVDLNKDLFVLQEELLFPANTQVALYISMDVGAFFALDSVTVKIDNKEVKNYLYTAREADALLKGGVQQIYLGNLKVGKHELVAFFTGKGPVERGYKRGATISFDKGVGAKYLELKITDRVPKHQPEFMIKDWE